MKVRTWKNVEVDFEVDVEIEDICEEFGKRAHACSQKHFRQILSGLDTITRAMAAIPDDVIGEIKPEHRSEISQRLQMQAGRWSVQTESEVKS